MIQSLLIDIDGTLYEGNHVVSGAPEALSELRRSGILFLLVTNTTRMAKAEILERLIRFGFDVKETEVFPVPVAACLYLTGKKPGAKRFVIGAPNLDNELTDAGFDIIRDEQACDFVVIGQYKWIDFGEIDIAQRLIQAGAEPVALHRDMSYPEDGVARVSLGPVVMVLEALTGVSVTIVGKPNPRFFQLALQTAGFDPSCTAMVGDNFDGDICGAINAGLQAIQVQTGNYTSQSEQPNNLKPTALLSSFAEIPAWLDNNKE